MHIDHVLLNVLGPWVCQELGAGCCHELTGAVTLRTSVIQRYLVYGWWRGEGVLDIDQGGNASVRDALTLEIPYPGT